ncbi:MAG: DinB family protein [Candidatus Rokubacteria bacterium]|nr:DinB family protein [Candidatus Rokubacteria bacterium]
MSIAWLEELYRYHWWANRRLFDVAAGLGEEVTGRDLGTQWSMPSVTRMFAHIYGADRIWLERFTGTSPDHMPGRDLATLAVLRPEWDRLEVEQKAFVAGLSPVDAGRIVPWTNTQGKSFQAPLGSLLQHVVNHATHHRSEIATMLTLVSGSPPDSGLATYLTSSGQPRP